MMSKPKILTRKKLRKEVLEQIDDISEERSKLRWDYEEQLDVLYKKNARKENN